MKLKEEKPPKTGDLKDYIYSNVLVRLESQAVDQK